MCKRVLSLLLVLSLCVGFLFPSLPLVASAEGEMCPNHLAHEGCNYREAVAEQFCDHTAHDKNCEGEITNCLHTSNDESCTYADTEGEEPYCHHICSLENGCITTDIVCKHVEDGSCCYAAPQEAVLCDHRCALCEKCEHGVLKAECSTCNSPVCNCEADCTNGIKTDCPVCGAENADLAVCTGKVLCSHGVEADCPVCAVEARIAALPSAEEMLAMDNDGRNDIYNALLETTDAYDLLSVPEQEAVTNLDKMIALHAAFHNLTATIPGGAIAIDAANFPDGVFRDYIAQIFDFDQDGFLSAAECDSVLNIHLNSSNLSSLAGIEHFPNLIELYCGNNQLTSLDVSSNTALTWLDCQNNQLTTLDVSSNHALQTLRCSKNQLTSLKVSSPALVNLYCFANQLTSLNISSPALVDLYCFGNQLTSLNISSCTALVTLDCQGNQLTTLDVSNNPALKWLLFTRNQLTSLDVSNNPALDRLICSYNLLTSLDVTGNTALTFLYCKNNHLTSLDLSSNPALVDLDCSGNNFSIQLSGSTYDLTALPGKFDVTKASSWGGGTVSGNALTVNADVSQVTYTYDCGNGKAMDVTLNVSGNSAPSEPQDPVTPTPAEPETQVPVVIPPTITKPEKAEITIPVSGESTSVAVDVTIQDTTATITGIRKEVETAMGGKDNDGAVKVDLSQVDRDLDHVQFPVNDLHHVINKRDDVTLEVAFPQGSVILDTKSMEAILDQSRGATLQVSLETTEIKELTNAQQQAIEELDVIGSLKASLVITQTNTQIFDLDDGKVTLSIPFEIPDNKLEKGFLVYGINEKGEKILCETRYEDGKLIWVAEELLDFVIVYDETAAQTFSIHDVKSGDTL